MKKNEQVRCLWQSMCYTLLRKLSQQYVLYFVVFACLSVSLHAEDFNSTDIINLTQKKEGIEKEITGKVVDRKNIPMPGVSVLVKGTTIGTVTDFDGTFSLTVKENSVVVFSFVGMKTQEVSATGKTVFEIMMEEDAIGLDEVIAVGYGTQIKHKVTSSISTIKTEEALEGRPIVSVQQGLSGMTPGLNVIQSNGRPGSFPELTIRGNGNPIVLVDGFLSSLEDLDPNQVKEISVLKDASATAIYGLQAANGVILITTKGGQKNKPVEFTYGTQASVQGYTKIPELANTVEYMQLRNKAGLNEQIYINGIDPASADPYALFSLDVINRAMEGEFFDTDWSDILYNENATQISQNLSLRGGTEKTVYSMDLGYIDQNGVNISDLDGFKRYNLRVKLQTNVNKWLTLGTNTAYTNRDQITVPIETGRYLRAVPYYSVKDHLGSDLYAVGDGGTSDNPVLTSNNGSFDKNLREVLEIQLNAKVKLLKRLSFEENVGVSILNTNSKNWTNVIDYASLEFDGQTGEYSANPISIAQSSGRALSYSTSRFQVITSQSLLRYDWSNNVHFVKALLGWQTEEKTGENFSTEREDFLSDAVLNLGLGGVETGLTNNSNANESSNLSALGRINYDYKGRYLAEFSFRNDWSSNFAKGYRSGFFPSFSLGWNIKEERFMAGIKQINLLKLRGAWGNVGLDNVSALSFIQRVNQNTGYPWSTGMEPGLVINNYASPTLTWETHKKVNLGMDLGLYNGKLNVIADVFRNRRYYILAGVQVSQEFGLPAPNVNRRSQEFRGWELVVTHKNNIGDFKYTVSVNATNVRSKWLSLGGEEPDYSGSLRKEGFSVGIAYGYRADGLISSQEELDEYVNNHIFEGPNTSMLYVGAPKLVDISGVDGVPDGIINATYDREIIDDLRADYRIGGQLGLAYKNISFSAVISGVLDRTIYATGGQSNHHFSGGVGNAFAVHQESFDPDSPNKNAAYPLVRSGLINYDRSSYWMRNASYIRVRNMNLNYSVNKDLLKKTNFLKKADLYISVENPFIIWDNFYASDYGWDPELGIGEVDYPLPRTFTIGANFTF